MSDLRIEKRRVEAEITLSTGTRVRGSFFLAHASPMHPSGEMIGEMLNASRGFFPFELSGQADEPPRVVLFNRQHVVLVHLAESDMEPYYDVSYEAARQKSAVMRMSSGERLAGVVHVFRPAGRDRLSDYARGPETFRYLETPGRTIIVNFDHVVEIEPIAE
jgi:hypothetical protein